MLKLRLKQAKAKLDAINLTKIARQTGFENNYTKKITAREAEGASACS